MCGGGQPATITQPDYTAFNQQFELQKAAIDRQMNNNMERQQARLNKKLQKQQNLLVESNEIKRQLAETTSAQAIRMAGVVGAPPPDKTAQAPTVGRAREKTGKTKGKSGLRIERKSAATSSQGTGLNIT